MRQTECFEKNHSGGEVSQDGLAGGRRLGDKADRQKNLKETGSLLDRARSMTLAELAFSRCKVGGMTLVASRLCARFGEFLIRAWQFVEYT